MYLTVLKFSTEDDNVLLDAKHVSNSKFRPSSLFYVKSFFKLTSDTGVGDAVLGGLAEGRVVAGRGILEGLVTKVKLQLSILKR